MTNCEGWQTLSTVNDIANIRNHTEKVVPESPNNDLSESRNWGTVLTTFDPLTDYVTYNICDVSRLAFAFEKKGELRKVLNDLMTVDINWTTER